MAIIFLPNNLNEVKAQSEEGERTMHIVYDTYDSDVSDGVVLEISKTREIREKIIDVLKRELPQEAQTLETVEYILDEVKNRLRRTPIL